ncbi:MAG TPA: EAL domain-containing protein [Gaiellaceae bacterium]|nr:EAL domain-containing protein [Gaiellaceae bacterium]
MQRLLPPWRRAAMRRPLHAGADAERPPRLVLRFAILSAVSLGVAAAAILGVTRSLNVSAAKQNVAKQMSFAAGTALADAFSGADLTRVPPEARRRVLDRRVERIFSSSDAVLVLSVAGPTGRITYSTDHRLIGRRLGAPGYFAAALGIENHTGHVISVEGRVAEPSRPSATRKTLDVYAPLFPHDDGHGVVLVSVDYSRVVAAAMKWFYPVAGILEATLVLLYALLMPLLLRVSRKLRQQLERIRHQAYHDDLTGLPNRLQFRDRVDAACREADAQRCAVMIVDLNRFKEINDTLGHRAGDELLRDLALRLKRRLPDEILVARLGGDEFGVLAPIETVKDAVQIAREIEQIIGENVQLRDIPLGVEGSIGIALAPDHGRDVDTVMQHADLAMYDAKARLGPLTLYSEELDRSQKAQVGLLAEFRRALERRELVVHYQPRASLRSGRITSVEALVRWQHPTRGLLYPGEFLPYVESTGLNRVLTSYVLETALLQQRLWLYNGVDLDVAVNVTMFDLLDSRFPNDVRNHLEVAGVEPHRLELEITETSIMSDTARVREALRQLRRLGIQIAIDDFGSGYSSLAYLKNLDVDTLKIDKSFILERSDDGRGGSVVRAIIDLAHIFDLTVVAEGVESEQEWRRLHDDGCDLAQGFLIAPAVTADTIVTLVRHAAPVDEAGAAERSRRERLGPARIAG